MAHSRAQVAAHVSAKGPNVSATAITRLPLPKADPGCLGSWSDDVNSKSCDSTEPQIGANGANTHSALGGHGQPPIVPKGTASNSDEESIRAEDSASSTNQIVCPMMVSPATCTPPLEVKQTSPADQAVMDDEWMRTLVDKALALLGTLPCRPNAKLRSWATSHQSQFIDFYAASDVPFETGKPLYTKLINADMQAANTSAFRRNFISYLLCHGCGQSLVAQKKNQLSLRSHILGIYNAP